jgi:hypothetical protein
MKSLDATATWTAEDLIAAASAAGLAATPRLIRNWTEEGLIDRPVVRGRGRARGVEAGVWSKLQLNLFVALLTQRQTKGVRLDASLANVPVWLWLWYGDQYVPIRQVRRALRTWAGPTREPPLRAADTTAKAVMARLSHPDASREARRRFRDLVRRGQAGEPVAWAALAAGAAAAMDPHRTGTSRGPTGAALSGRSYATHVAAVIRGRDAILIDRQGETVPDRLLRHVRDVYRRTRSDYYERRPEFARDPDLGHLHLDESLDREVNDAGLDLVTLVGYELSLPRWRTLRTK